jgi:hypothetical protein
MDRNTVNIARSQIGFIDVIINPAFQAAAKIINMEPFLLNLESNKKRWQESFDEYETRMLHEQNQVSSATSHEPGDVHHH